MKTFLYYLIALVWIVNGLFCKVLNFVPRHQEIVGKILGEEHSFLLIKIIGVLEIGMAVWVLSKFKSRFCAILQIIVIGTMNLLEFILAPELLLFGKINSIIAILFMTVIYINEFVLVETPIKTTN
ncbi:DoxX-like family protein [Flavobacterium sp.]|uniref:DoxX-like family protein n=1 Tax=Flavobacterium sp. TaxID=239 RepID=UPI002613E09D|nr:DoxX-like family protein [Flavobacterium sp.]